MKDALTIGCGDDFISEDGDFELMCGRSSIYEKEILCPSCRRVKEALELQRKEILEKILELKIAIRSMPKDEDGYISDQTENVFENLINKVLKQIISEKAKVSGSVKTDSEVEE